MAPPSKKLSARDAILELKARIGKSALGQDHLVESMLIDLACDVDIMDRDLHTAAPTEGSPSGRKVRKSCRPVIEETLYEHR